MVRELTRTELEAFPSLEWSDAAARVNPALRSSLEKVLETQNGGDLSLEEAYALANSEGDDLLGVLAAANLLRAELCGNIVTYVVNRNINFTNICFVGCKFCAFSRGPREEDSYFHSLDDMARKAVEAWELGATEVCIQGGLPRELSKFYYRDILRAIKQAVPRIHIHAFSPMEIVYGVELTGMPLDRLSFHAARQRAGDAAWNGGRNSRRPDSPHSFGQQTFHGAVGRGDSHGASLRHSHHFDSHVRARGDAGPLGTADAAAARDSSGNRWVHRVRAAGVRASEHVAVSAGAGAHRVRRWRNI